MADNVTLPGTGIPVASDDVGGIQVQRVKTTWGPDGTANDTDVASGKPLPTQLRHSDGTIVTDATGIKISTASQNANGRAAAASSGPVVWSTEDSAVVGALTETAPASDTASSGLNGRLQRVAQRITSLIALVPTSLGAKTAANSFATTTATDDNTLVLYGALTETAPASDTASSGLNGRLQRIAQRLTSIIALFGPQTTGGLSTYYNADLDQVAVAVKASAGGTFNVMASNRTTAPLYVHFWDVAQGSVTVGTTPVKFTVEIPGNASDHTLAMPNFNPHGIAFGTAITMACTTAFDGTGSPATNACLAAVAFK